MVLAIVCSLCNGKYCKQCKRHKNSIYANYDYATEILVASVRSTQHVVDAALVGADVGTLPPKILTALYQHPLTDSGLDSFLKDWAKTGQSIL